LTDIREIREQVRQLQREAEEIKTTFADVNQTFTLYLALANRAGLRGDVMTVLRQLQQIRIALQLTLRAIQLFEAASGPVGWAVALGTTAMALFTVQNSVYEVSNR